MFSDSHSALSPFTLSRFEYLEQPSSKRQHIEFGGLSFPGRNSTKFAPADLPETTEFEVAD